jgi:hypothetical protein
MRHGKRWCAVHFGNPGCVAGQQRSRQRLNNCSTRQRSHRAVRHWTGRRQRNMRRLHARSSSSIGRPSHSGGTSRERDRRRSLALLGKRTNARVTPTVRHIASRLLCLGAREPSCGRSMKAIGKGQRGAPTRDFTQRGTARWLCPPIRYRTPLSSGARRGRSRHRQSPSAPRPRASREAVRAAARMRGT